MPSEVLVTAFVDDLEKHQLLGPVQLREARGLNMDARELGGELIRRGWLTPFQVNRVLQGRAETLVLGAYVLLERIGEGGMGQVYKARHTLMDRVVALKVIRADRVDQPDAVGRFQREMQAAAKLIHPNVVLALDAGRAGADYFLAMEFIDGIDLARLVKERGRLPAGQACDYVRQAALGLQHAHERGLVHRDVKPSNLMLATAGHVVKVLDLGLARLRVDLDAAATASGLSREGMVMGTLDYIAPEQALDARTADVRADIYSLGCTLYHLLAGQPPFPGGTLTEKLLKHQQAEPEPIERLCPAVAPGLASVIGRMMAKRPADRYPTPQAVAEALAPFAAAGTGAVHGGAVTTDVWTPDDRVTPARMDDSTTAVASVPPRSGPKRAAARRSPWLLLALVAAALLFVALPVLLGVPLLLMFLVLGSAPVAHGDAEMRVDLEQRGKPAVQESPQPPEKAIEPPGEPRPQPQPLPPDKPADGPKLVPIPVEGPAKLIKDLKGHTAIVQCLAFSADGKRLASGADDHQVRLWDGLTGTSEGAPLRLSHAVSALAFSPRGKQLAAASHGAGFEAEVKLWDLPAGDAPQILAVVGKTGTPTAVHVRALAFSPDGKRLAAAGGPLRLWDLERGGAPTQRSWQEVFPSYSYGVAFAPDGKTVAAGCHEQGDSVRVWAVDGPAAPTILQGKAKAIGLAHMDVRGAVAYFADGKRLARVTSGGQGGFQAPAATVMVWDVESAERVTLRDTLKIPGGTVFALASGADGLLRVAVAAGNPGPGANPGALSPPYQVAIWDQATGAVRTLTTGHKDSVTALAFTPDGTRLASGSADQSVKLWDLTR